MPLHLTPPTMAHKPRHIGVHQIMPSHVMRIAMPIGWQVLTREHHGIDTGTSMRHPAWAQGLPHRSPAREAHVLQAMPLAPTEEPRRATARIHWHESAREIISREENHEHDAAWFSRLTPSGPLSWRLPLRTVLAPSVLRAGFFTIQPRHQGPARWAVAAYVPRVITSPSLEITPYVGCQIHHSSLSR